MELRHYLTDEGGDPTQQWLDSLPDLTARVAILRRLDRLVVGNLGDHKFCRDGVWELRIDQGPGYRVYFGQSGKTVILLLGGGVKRTQSRDIERAIGYWREFKRKQL